MTHGLIGSKTEPNMKITHNVLGSQSERWAPCEASKMRMKDMAEKEEEIYKKVVNC